MNITLQLIQEIAEPNIVSRGRKYFQQHRVTLEEVTDSFVFAYVEGSDTYEVELFEDDLDFDATCTCPYDWDGYCKHVVAAMFATMEEVGNVVSDSRKKRSAEITNPAQEKTSWVNEVKKILPQQVPDYHPAQTQQPWRLVYSLNVSGGTWSVQQLRIKMRKNGSDGKASVIRQFDSSDRAHFDLTDRLLIAQLTLSYQNSIFSSGYSSESYFGSWSSHGYISSSSRDKHMADVLSLLIDKEVYRGDAYSLMRNRIHVRREPARLRLTINSEGTALSLNPEMEWQGNIIPFPKQSIILTSDPLWILLTDEVLRVEGATGAEFAALKQVETPLVIPEADRDEFVSDLFPQIVSRYKIRSEASILKTVDAQPVPRLYLKEVDEKLAVELRFFYETVEVLAFKADAEGANTARTELISDNGALVHVARKFDAEAAMSKTLFDSSLTLMPNPSVADSTRRAAFVCVPAIHPLEWLLTVLPALQAQGFEIFGQEDLKKHRLRYDRPKVGMKISSGIDWFDLSVEMKVEGTAASFEEFARAVNTGEHFVKLDDGSFGVLADEWIKKFHRTFALAQRVESSTGQEDDRLTLSRAHLGMIDELLAGADEVDTDALFEEMRERLKSFNKIETQSLPRAFSGELRPYQHAGYDWLHFLREFGVNGILADDMGLGKTVQTLVLLQKVYEDGAALPSLIVVPASPLFNWEKEIRRFTPDLTSLIYKGLDRKQFQESFAEYKLILTSYGILRRDIEVLKDQEFLYVVLDESQNIKNPGSINAKAVRLLKAHHRLALSGTPVENTLMDLWSQFAFLNPGMLGSERSFSQNFARPIERHNDESTASALKRLIFPFILRRTKELVAKELPPKVETTIYCEMDKAQRVAYEHWREYYRRAILKSIETVGFQRSKMKVLEGLMKLRQVCCHPLLVDAKCKGSAGKYDAFIEMLADILAEGHKMLVFSQFVKMLKVLRAHCDEHALVYEYLDGSTTDRKERVERFQNDESVKLFLISLKAGGTGLNLTAADYVIHYDPWWNPAVEMQATDRTHRIGQTKQVFAYKLITRETVEEKILALQEKKQALVKSIITTDSGFMKSLTKEDVEVLFS